MKEIIKKYTGKRIVITSSRFEINSGPIILIKALDDHFKIFDNYKFINIPYSSIFSCIEYPQKNSYFLDANEFNQVQNAQDIDEFLAECYGLDFILEIILNDNEVENVVGKELLNSREDKQEPIIKLNKNPDGTATKSCPLCGYHKACYESYKFKSKESELYKEFICQSCGHKWTEKHSLFK